MNPFSFGAIDSPYDVRTFTFVPTKANIKGGERWKPEDIEHQHAVGICTAISTTMQAGKVYGVPMSADFQYLCQKKFYDNKDYPDWQWGEGSSGFSAVRVAKNIGFLPASEWKHTTTKDRKLSYQKYIAKLKAIPDKEIERLKKIAAKYKIKAYAQVKSLDRDTLALAIDESKCGVLTRYTVGKEWWTQPIEPLRPPQQVVSGHLVTDTNYDGNSFRIANSWGTGWADKGTAYRLHRNYSPTEAWIMYWNEIPKPIEKDLEDREKMKGQLQDILQKLLELLRKIKVANT